MKKKIFIFFIAVFAVVFVVTVTDFIQRSVKNEVTFLDEMPQDYQAIFKPEYQKKLVFKSGTTLKLGGTTVIADYKENTIMVKKMPAVPNFNLNKDVFENIKQGDNGPDISSQIKGDEFTIVYDAESYNTINKLYLSTDTPVRASHKNDTLAYYYANLKEGYIRYKPDGQYEFSLKATGQTVFSKNAKPIIIAFVKKDNYLYLIFMWQLHKTSVLKPDDLYDIINH